MPIGSNIMFYDSLPSTNSHAAILLKTDTLPEGTIIHAAYQSAGRGQMSKHWESEAGKNLLISIILYPLQIKPTDLFLISMTISLGISDFLSGDISGCKIKWPNDIYVNNDKIAGILIENTIMDNAILNSVAGIGLNINQRKFISDAPNPVSMSSVTGSEYDLKICLKRLSETIDLRYSQLIAGQYTEIRHDYTRQLYRLNEWSNFLDSNGKFTGRLLTVKENGNLIVERDNRTIQEYSFREVEFIL